MAKLTHLGLFFMCATLFSCSTTPIQVTLPYKISYQRSEAFSNFYAHKDNIFSIQKIDFSNRSAIDIFFERRLYYQKAYEEVIEPYYGKAISSPCASDIDTKAPINNISNEHRFYRVEVLSNARGNLSPCGLTPPPLYAIIELHLIHNQLIEVKYISREKSSALPTPLIFID